MGGLGGNYRFYFSKSPPSDEYAPEYYYPLHSENSRNNVIAFFARPFDGRHGLFATGGAG